MANYISDQKFDYAFKLAYEGKSIREISRIVGISKQTANDIQKACREIYKTEDNIEIPKAKTGYWAHKKHMAIDYYNSEKSPCIGCEFQDRDKNHDDCINCERRLQYLGLKKSDISATSSNKKSEPVFDESEAIDNLLDRVLEFEAKQDTEKLKKAKQKKKVKVLSSSPPPAADEKKPKARTLHKCKTVDCKRMIQGEKEYCKKCYARNYRRKKKGQDIEAPLHFTNRYPKFCKVPNCQFDQDSIVYGFCSTHYSQNKKYMDSRGSNFKLGFKERAELWKALVWEALESGLSVRQIIYKILEKNYGLNTAD